MLGSAILSGNMEGDEPLSKGVKTSQSQQSWIEAKSCVSVFLDGFEAVLGLNQHLLEAYRSLTELFSHRSLYLGHELPIHSPWCE